MNKNHEKKHKNHLRHIKNIFKDEDRLLFSSFVIIMTALVVVAVIYVSNRTGIIVYKTTPAIASAPTQVLSSSQTANSDAYTINVSDVYTTSKKDPAFTIADNETFLIANLSIKNNTSNAQNLFPVTQIYVRSQDGSYYPMHASVHVTKPLQSGQIAPGQTMQGQVSFAIPKKLSNPLLYIDLGWNSLVPVVYDVLR